MIRKLIIALTSFYILSMGMVYGQSGVIGSYNADKIVPQSPDVGKFTKYGEYPVNLTSGLVDVSVPIYTIKTKQLELPISISAHLSGIKVDEVAGNIGLGWTLNAGGMLSIQVQGARSDSHLASGIKYKAPDANALGAEVDDGINFRSKMMSYAYNDDTQSDKYRYAVSGIISGSFVFDNEGSLMQIPLTDNKIEIDSRYFIVTGPDGIKYYFDKNVTSKTSISGGTGGSNTHETGYYLTKILSADKRDSIILTYKNMAPHHIFSAGFIGRRKSEVIVNPTPQYLPIKYYDSYTFYDYAIEKITFNGGEMIFETHTDRQDKGSYRFSGIQVNQKISVDQQQCILKCDFINNEYFRSLGVVTRPEHNIYYNRMKLAGVDMKSCDVNGENQSYRFFYNSLMLPHYDVGENQVWRSESYAQDLWGYYNGKHDNPHLVPFDYGDEAEFKRIMNNTSMPDRSVSEVHARAVSLEKIVYPAGGYTIFDLESNQRAANDLYGGLRVKRVRSYDKNHTLSESKEYEYLHGYNISTNGFIPHTSSYKEIYIQIKNPKLNPDGNTSEFKNGYWESLVYSSSPGIFQLQSTSPLYYDSVVEYNGRKEFNTGKKIYTYTYTENSINGNPGYGTAPRRYTMQTVDRSWSRGDLLGVSTFKNVGGNYVEVENVANEYAYYKGYRKIVGLVVTQSVEIVHEPGLMYDPKGVKNEVSWFNTFAETGMKKLVRRTITQLDNGTIANSKSTAYNFDKIEVANNGHNLLTSEVSVLSNGKTRKKYYKYPLDYSYTVTNGNDYLINKKLRDNHVLNAPIEIWGTISSDSQELVTDGIFFRYKDAGHPSDIYAIETETPFVYSGATSIGSNGYNISDKYRLVTKMNYDTDNNVIEISKNDGVKTSFLWGYKSNYPIARFENASFVELESAISNAGLTYSSFLSDTKTDMSKIDLLKNRLPKAQIFVFSYSPLKGISSLVDSRLQKTSYNYDGHSRLKSVVDHDDRFLKVYDYHMGPNSSELRLYTENQYYLQRTVAFEAEIINGTGNYQYDWKLLGPTGNLISSSTDRVFTTRPSVLGISILQCKITDITNGKVHQTSRSLNIINSPVLNVSDIKPSINEFRVNGQPINFSIVPTEGSFDYAYSWTLQTPTKTETSTSKNFHVKLNEIGSMIVKCTVTDSKLNQSITKQFNFTSLVPLPLTTLITSTMIPTFGNSVWFKVGFEEGTGSGNFSAPIWTITTPTKTLNYTGTPFQYTFDEKGAHKFKACVTDIFTGLVTCMENDYIIKQALGFEDVVQTSSGSSFTLNANIFCADVASVTFNLALDRTQTPMSSSASFMINGQYHSLMSGSTTVTVPLKKGDNSIRISYTKTPGVTSIERASITIVSAPSDYTIGNSTKVTLNAL